MTVADEVAAYLGEHCPVVFGVIGAGNMSIFDAIARLGRTTVVCCHHEQAAVMAAAAYFRVAGRVSCAIVTTGAGSSNALSGCLSANMDSIPVVVIAGNEPSTRRYVGRAIGVQGYGAVEGAREFTKGQQRLTIPRSARTLLAECFRHARDGRPGAVWLEIPMDIASAAA